MKLLTILIISVIFLSLDGMSMVNSNEFEKGIQVPGKYLQAWNVCYIEFGQIGDLSKEEKLLVHYNIKFYENEDNYLIHFIPKLLSEEQAKSFNRMVLGREIKYWIDKSTLSIKKRVFYKA